MAEGKKLGPGSAATQPYGLSRLGMIDDCAKHRIVQTTHSVNHHMPGPTSHLPPKAERKKFVTVGKIVKPGGGGSQP